MKRTIGRIKQLISLLLAAAMIITCVPQTGLSVLAEERAQASEIMTADDTAAPQEDAEMDGEYSGVGGGAQSDEDGAAGEVQSGTNGDANMSDDPVPGEDDDGNASDGSADTVDSGAFGEGEDEAPVSYLVTVVGTDRVLVEYEKTVQPAHSYTFTVEAREGYVVEDVRIYRTSEYEGHEDALDGVAAIEAKAEDTETEGRTRYTIAEGVIDADLTIVVSADAAEDEAGYALASVEDETIEDESTPYNVALVAESAQADVTYEMTVSAGQEYSFTVQAKENYEIRDVKVYKTSDYDANKEDLSASEPIAMTSENTATEGEKKYTIAADVIDSDITIVVTAQEIDAGQCTVVVEYPRSSGAGAIGKVTYAIGDSTKFLAYNATRGIAAQKGQKIRIKIAAITAGYVAYVDKGAEGKEYFGSDGIYTIASAQDETVSIRLEEKTFAVSCEVLGKNADEQVSVKGSGIAAGELTGEVKANAALTVGVSAKFDNKTRRLGGVTYQIGEEESVAIDLTDSQRRNGSAAVKIPRDTITGDVKITITLEDIPKYKISFVYDSRRVGIQFSGGTLQLDADNSIEVLEGSSAAKKLVFQPIFTDAGSMFKVKSVTADANDASVRMSESGTCALMNIAESFTVYVEIGLDENKCNSLAMAANGHRGSFHAAVTGFVDGDDYYNIAGMTWGAGEQVLTQADELTVTIVPEESYQIDKVELDGKELSAADSGQKIYQISFGGAKAAKKTLTVHTSPIPTEEEKTITFVRAEDNQSAGLDVKETDKIKKSGENQYTIEAGAAYFDFTVTMEGNEFDPNVSYMDNEDQAQVKWQTGYREREGNVFHYSLAANRLPENATIQIERREVKHSVKVRYDITEVRIASARIGVKEIEGKFVTDAGSGRKYYEYQVPRGQTISIRAEAEDNCKILSAETTSGGVTKTERTEASGFTFSVTADMDSITEIESDGLLNTRPLQEVGGGELTPVSGTYQVSCYRSYRGGVMRGTEASYYDEIEVKVGGKAVDPEDPQGLDVQMDPSGGTFELDLTDQVANKTIEVNLYTVEEDDDEGSARAKKTKIASYKLKVGASLSNLTVKGIPSSGELTLGINMVAEYALTPTPANADLEVLHIESSDPEVVRAEREGNILRLTAVEQREVGKTATVRIYMNDDSESGEKEFASIKVTTVWPLEGKKPGVSLKRANDRVLTLTLTAPKGVAQPVVGSIEYIVEVTPQDRDKKPDDVRSSITPVSVKVTDETSQDVEITVSDADVGKGTPWNFDVAVYMVQFTYNDGGAESVLYDGTAEAVHAVYATGKAYFEENLKLKKGTTTVYTGQENVIAAIPQFGRNTTYTEVTVRDVTYPSRTVDGKVEPDDRALQVTTDRSQNVIVSAPRAYSTDSDGDRAVNGTALGKHRLEVIAMSPDSMYASRATLDVTVVRGIDELQIALPSTSLYKADKKAASMKLQPVYNMGWSGVVPKTKKVTWEIVGTDEKPLEQGSRLYGMVAVKNGTVTVNKNYKPSGAVSDNQFKVKVTAADYKDSKVSACSETITVTGEGMILSDIAVVRAADDGSLDVIARNYEKDKKLIPEDMAQNLEGAYVVVFAAGAPKKDRYTQAEAQQYIIRENIGYQTSNAKALSIGRETGREDSAYGYGKLSVLKPAKKVKLTVTAQDGSKAKQELTITVNDDPAGVLGVELWKYNVNDRRYDHFSDPVETSDMQFRFQDSTASRFKLIVKQQVSDENGEKHWEPITSNTSYKVTVSGGKILSQNQKEQSVEIAANGEIAKITVTNNGSGIAKGQQKAWQYTLTNTAYTAAKAFKAPKVTLGSLRTSGWAQEIQGSFQKDALTPAAGYEGLYAKIEVDWTAKTVKNEAALWKIENQLAQKSYFPLEKDGSFVLRFNEDGAAEPGQTSFDAGSYKMKASVGTIDGNGNFNPSRKEASVTLKVVKPKAASFKMTASYTMAAADSASVILTGKGNYDTVSFTALKSANVKGSPNNFIRYFELDETTGQLRLTEAWYEDVRKSESGQLTIDKSDLTGYVSYTARTFADYDAEANKPDVDDEKEFCLLDKAAGTVKITIKFQGNAKAKYKLASSSIGTAEGSQVKLPVTVSKKPVKLAYAIIKPESESENTWKIAHNDGGIRKLDEGSEEITLTSVKSLDKNKKYAAELCIIPADSYYVSIIETAINAGQVEEAKSLIVRYGITIKANITAKD